MCMPFTSSTRAEVKSQSHVGWRCCPFYHRKQCLPEWWHSRSHPSPRSDLVQGRTVGNQAVTGNRSVGRLNAGDAAEGAWLADGTAGIGTQSEEALHWLLLPRRNRRRNRPAHARVPRVFCLAVSRSLCGASHGELVHVGLAQDDGTCCFQVLDGLCR